MNPSGLAFLGAGVGAGIAVLGAGQGIGKLVASAIESQARQPEMAGRSPHDDDHRRSAHRGYRTLRARYLHYSRHQIEPRFSG